MNSTWDLHFATLTYVRGYYNIGSVSYTHLDVYKRQVLTALLINKGFLKWLVNEISSLEIPLIIRITLFTTTNSYESVVKLINILDKFLIISIDYRTC